MSETENSVRSYRVCFILVVLTLFFFRIWFISSLPLSGDESYHWEWSRHLALGYYDHPGLTAYLIRSCTILFGASTETSVRFAALLMLTLTSIVGYLLARRITLDRGGTACQSERAGFLGGFILLVVPIYALFSVYISTDPPLIFFWTLSVYYLYRAFNGGRYFDWIIAGMAIGLTLMSKFLGFFIFPAAFMFMILSPDDRKWFSRWHVYAAAVACLIVVAPFVWWNMQNGWPTFMFNFIYRQEYTGIHPLKALEYVGGQALALSPVIFVCAIISMVFALRKWKSNRDRASLFIALTSIIPLLYFLYVGFRRTVGLHWPTAGWVGSLMLWASYASSDWRESRRARLSANIAFGVCLFITIALHLLVHIPQRWIESSWSYWGDPKRINLEKSAERYGWPDLGRKVYTIKKDMLSVQEDGRGVFVMCDQYGLASNVAFYSPDQMETHLWTSKKVHGENYRFWDKYEKMKDMDALFVTKTSGKAASAMPLLKKHFLSVGVPEHFVIQLDGKNVRSFYFVRCHRFNGVAPET